MFDTAFDFGQQLATFPPHFLCIISRSFKVYQFIVLKHIIIIHKLIRWLAIVLFYLNHECGTTDMIHKPLQVIG